SRLYRRLVKEKQLFSEINAYILGSLDHNLLVVEGKPSSETSIAQAEEAIWEELEALKQGLVSSEELTKVKNKIESTLVFSELSILDKAMNLAFYELLGDAGYYNQEAEKYLEVTTENIKRVAVDTFQKENSSTLIYHSRIKEDHAQ
ncbi:MAG: M16 family metallopeptidase, partial [Sphingobacterium sp.]